MIWLRVLAGVVFLLWLVAFIYAMWSAMRPLPRPEDWTTDKGQLDPHSEEFRRLIMR